MEKKKTRMRTKKELSEELIETLKNQGYEHALNIRDKQGLRNNLRKQIEKLNAKNFTEKKWDRFFEANFEGKDNVGVEKRTKKIQWKECKVSLDENNEIYLIDRENFRNNSLQVINHFQALVDVEKRHDLTILVNGLPLVHIELKGEAENIKEQMAGSKKTAFRGLFEFIQIFIISNGNSTRYYSNTARKEKDIYSRSYCWSDFNNEKIECLRQFALDFLSRDMLLKVLTKYCVFDSCSKLKILRPYQIAAVEGILKKIESSIDQKTTINEEASGGYIWHTMGSGKTLTSFAVSWLAHKIKKIKKVLFVVDRVSLCGQTYDKYKKFLGEAPRNKVIKQPKNTKELAKLMNDNGKSIIITTVQKLRELRNHEALLKREFFEDPVVIIMDECHRSQTEDMHNHVEKFFKKRYLFGFTGTPLFEEAKSQRQNKTEELFGEEIHSYKHPNALNDRNVLPFVVDKEKDFPPIDDERRIPKIVEHIIEEFEIKTRPKAEEEAPNGQLESTRFSSILATESTKDAMKYYKEFQKQLEEKKRDIKFAIIFSPTPENHGEQKSDNDSAKSKEKSEFLKSVKKDYERQFVLTKTNYKDDVADKLKKVEIDILIVVDMFLTGFDAPRLNTLWLDKTLQGHNLIQAISRTIRVCENKSLGNIVFFREKEKMKDNMDAALKCYSWKERQEIAPFSHELRKKYYKRLDHFLREYPLEPNLIEKIVEAGKQKDYIEQYTEIKKLEIKLSSDKRFIEGKKMTRLQTDNYKQICEELSEQKQSIIYSQKMEESSRENAAKDENTHSHPGLDKPLTGLVEHEVRVDIDYLIDLRLQSLDPRKKEEVLKVLNAEPTLKQKEDLVLPYLDRKSSMSFKEHKQKTLEEKISKVAQALGVDEEKTLEFVKKCIKEDHMALDEITKMLLPAEESKLKKLKDLRTFNEKKEKLKEQLFNIFDLFKEY